MDHTVTDAVFIPLPSLMHPLIPAPPGGYLHERPVPLGEEER